jgi:DNA polymerase III subunit epsilon
VIILSFDFETTGLDRNADRVIEVGAVLYSTTLAQTLESAAFLVQTDVAITKEITELTGIRKAMVDKFGLGSKSALTKLLNMVEDAEALVGQNVVEFDVPFLESWCIRENETLPSRLIIDTTIDLPDTTSKHLGYMAADAGFLNPFPHRALSDCLTVLKLISLHDGKQKPTTFDDIVTRAKSPRVTIAANVTREQNQLARKRGYRWAPAPRNIWYKNLKELDLEKEAKEAPFDIARVQPVPMH